jgi:hypothetical protein
VNFSLLQAVASWVQEALRLAPVHLPEISQSAELLSRAVASTSGLGLNDIWSTWTSSISPSSYANELEQAASDADNSGEVYSELSPEKYSTQMLTSTQDSDRSYWSTLRRDILKQTLPLPLTLIQGMFLFHQNWGR